MKLRTTVILLALASVPMSARAKDQSGYGDMLSGLMGKGSDASLGNGLLPSLGSTGIGNAAGVLGYCVKNNYLSGDGVQAVLGNLLGQKGVKSSGGFSSGQMGLLQTGKKRTLSLDSVKKKIRTKVCSLVLDHARSFL